MKLLKKINKKILSISLATAMALGFVSAPMPMLLEVGQSVAYAETHNVTSLPTPDAEGKGGGATSGLVYYNDRYSTIRPGDTDVPTNAMLLLSFNKNVVTTRPNYPNDSPMILVNYDKIELFKNGVKIDDLYLRKVSQDMINSAGYAGTYTERNYRNYLYLPATLEPNTTYTVHISKDLAAANGQTIGQLYPNGITFNFTTSAGPR